VEPASFKEATELLDIEAIGGHVGVLRVPFPRNLMHHKVGVSEAEDPLDANLFGQLKPMHQGLVLGEVVRRAEVDLKHIHQLVSLRRSEDDTGSQAPVHLGAIEVHSSVGGVRSRWQVLVLSPVSKEVS
jgi:hypothetical protein